MTASSGVRPCLFLSKWKRLLWFEIVKEGSLFDLENQKREYHTPGEGSLLDLEKKKREYHTLDEGSLLDLAEKKKRCLYKS